MRDDPLLGVARLALTAALGVCIFVVTALPVALVAMLIRKEQLIADLADHRIDAAALPWIAALLVLIALMFALGFFFLRHLRRIVDSVSQDDPFAPINASRLNHMAWLVLAIQMLLLPATALAVWFDAAPYRMNVHYGADGISFGALLLALILFILARVFRTGATMRDELEGTV